MSPERIKEINKLFRRCDKNGDGKVEECELYSALKHDLVVRDQFDARDDFSRAEFRETFAEMMDLDSDGGASMQEFVHFFQREDPKNADVPMDAIAFKVSHSRPLLCSDLSCRALRMRVSGVRCSTSIGCCNS